MPRARVPLALGAEEFGVERCPLIDVRDLNGDAEDLRRVRLLSGSHRCVPFKWAFALLPPLRVASECVDFGPEETHCCAGVGGLRWSSQPPTTRNKRSRLRR